jgi:hypothetical protein
MTDLLWTLAAILACAVAHAWIETRLTPKPAAPRRNYDVLAPAPRSQATRRAHDATVAGIWGPDWLIIRDEREARDARQ